MEAATIPGSLQARVQEYQRNASFAAFILVVCTSAFVYLTHSLRSMLLPLVWSAFWALPLTALMGHINHLAVCCSRWAARLLGLSQGPSPEPVPFAATAGEASVQLERGPATAALVRRVRPHPNRWCRPFASCCRRRVRITRLRSEGPSGRDAAEELSQVNRLVLNWAYYATAEPDGFEGDAEAGMGEQAPVRLELFLDQKGNYPAVLEGARAVERRPLRGTLELDETTRLSWGISILLVMAVVSAGIWIFITFIWLGVHTFRARDTQEAYGKGIQEFVAAMQHALRHFQGLFDADQVNEYLASTLQELASMGFSQVQSILVEAVLFFIYLAFWLCEPLPVSSSVSEVFRSYLLLKTMVCMLFSGLMSIVLACLGCQLWHIFFVITFLLNYLPEIGPLVSFALMLPAILLDGSIDQQQRNINSMLLLFFFVLFKMLTGNVIEVKMYATRGGEFMRMHPVVMMALIMLFEALLGFSGMFLAIPFMAALKYYMVSTNMPEMFLGPLLKLIEGDEAAPHRMFVYQHRLSQKVADAAAKEPSRLPLPAIIGAAPGSRHAEGDGWHESL